MTAFRLISLPMHAAVEITCGLALMVAPFLLGFGAGPAVVSLGLGALLVGLALAAATEPAGLRVATHWAFDQATAIALLGAALTLAIADERTAAATLGAAGVVQLVLHLTTRYSARGS